MLSPIEETIAALTDSNNQLLNSRLIELSNLSSAELAIFQDTWTMIGFRRRRQIMSRLVELAEDNLELNFDGILKYCLRDSDAEVRSRAIEGLWENEEASLINPLINQLEQDSSEKVRARAATALGKFAILAEHKKLRSTYAFKVQETLLMVTGDKKLPLEVRRRALEAIAPLSLSQVKAAIREAYQDDNAKLKVSAIYAMGRNCDPSWLPIIVKELTNTDAEVRYEAAGACGELEEEAVVPGLIKLADGDPDTDVRITAIQSLGKIGGTRATECLKRCLDSKHEAVRRTAEQVLSELEMTKNPLLF